MTEERTDHEKSRCDLNRELESVLKTAGSEAAVLSSQDHLTSEVTQNLCNVVEAIFIHGLRDAFFLKGSRFAKYPEPNFWPFVSKYSHKSITKQINDLKQIKTEIGKSRAWIRIVLNESSLEHYLQLLLTETQAMCQFYNDFAFLRDAEQVDRMLGFIKGLSGIPIQAAINSSFLNAWTPSPLILAGLATGQIVKIAAKKSTPPESADGGTTAVDYLPAAVAKLSPIRPHHEAIMKIGSFSDDDASSIYSHPSMLDRNDRVVMLSSTPKDAFVLQHSVAPLLVSRRTKRPRRSSRSSSESNSKGSHKNSDAGTSKSALESEVPNSLPHSLAASLPMKHFLENEAIVEGESQGTSSDSLMVKEVKESREESESGGPAREVETVQGDDAATCTSSEGGSEHQTLETPTEEHEQTESSGSVDSPENSQETEESVASENETSEIVVEREEMEENKASSGSDESSDILERIDEMTSCRIDIPSGSNHEDSTLGTSLHDELISALSCETIPTGNALTSSGAWAVPRPSWDGGDGDTSGILSSSSGSSSIPVSFGQALRSAMEQHSPTEEELNEFCDQVDGGGDEDKENIRKQSQQMDIDQRLTGIAKEKGLPEQLFRCPMCRKSIGLNFSKFEMCGMDGLYYCPECIKPGGTYSIPGRVLHSWDWKERFVSDRGRAFIEANLDRPVFNIREMNPSLYDHVPALRNILKIRERLQIASLYLFNCRESIAEDFRQRIHPRDYLYKEIHLYSFMDLQNVRTGNLEKQLNGWLKHAIGHVMTCNLCRQKGFVCEICEKREVIYPFNTDTTHRCPDCFSVYHSQCSASSPCPKCARRAKYEVKENAGHLALTD